MRTLVPYVESDGVDAVFASASCFCSDAHALERWTQVVAAACQARGVPLVLGGRGAWPDAPLHAARVRDFGSLQVFLAGVTFGAKRHRGTP
jgi:hypothetical protein